MWYTYYTSQHDFVLIDLERLETIKCSKTTHAIHIHFVLICYKFEADLPTAVERFRC
jgi:hypothetical protein